MNNGAASSISLSEDSMLRLNGDFEIGEGVKISAWRSAKIEIGGKKNSTGSGVTANSIIIAEKQITIGEDVIISWNCSIIDTDAHLIDDTLQCIPVEIGSDVWIGHDVSVLKGAIIPDGCIVAPKSLVSRNPFRPRSLIAGIPAVIKRENVCWKR